MFQTDTVALDPEVTCRNKEYFDAVQSYQGVSDYKVVHSIEMKYLKVEKNIITISFFLNKNYF